MIHRPAGASPLAAGAEALLHTHHFGRPMRGYASVTSTNAVAAAWAAEGAAEGSVVVAEHQTAGRGRLGRTWTSEAGRNLTFSVVLRPALPPSRLGLVTLAGAVAAAEAIEAFASPLTPAIKWPNDLLFEERKCCGMLLETVLPGVSTALPTLILGVGLNVNQAAFAPELEGRVTSLLLETGRPQPRAPLLARLLLCLEATYASLLDDGGAAVRTVYEARLAHLGEPVRLRLTETGACVPGIVRGVTPEGALRLQTNAGQQIFHAGEVTTQPA